MRIHGMGTAKFARQGVSHRSGHPYGGRRDGDRAPAAQLEANMDPGLLIAQVSHGPGGVVEVHMAFLATLLVGGLAFLALRRRRSSDRDHGSDRRPEP
jgi:hypothetical protein